MEKTRLNLAIASGAPKAIKRRNEAQPNAMLMERVFIQILYFI